ncbi:uncharacterized protein LOC119455735 [Dermacentor silvarum]|uniref:uncharacterized protein LOC119455735 n=1 Tax=Dermacentor silvarum TaxID=543639 RepID=UPI0018971926|nr:uncharacterized protein LOC119455735 [Dermacentor silvarum]
MYAQAHFTITCFPSDSVTYNILFSQLLQTVYLRLKALVWCFIRCTRSGVDHDSEADACALFCYSAFKHYSAVPLHIVNLGEPGHSDYRMYPGSAASIHQGAFCEVLNSLSADGSLEMVNHMHRLHNLLHTKLREVLNSVAESEEDVATFVDDILQLREKYGALKKATVGPSTSASASESVSTTSK